MEASLGGTRWCVLVWQVGWPLSISSGWEQSMAMHRLSARMLLHMNRPLAAPPEKCLLLLQPQQRVQCSDTVLKSINILDLLEAL
jgi:hypothetical protein